MDSPGWTLDSSRLAAASPAPPLRRLCAFDSELPWLLTVALSRGLTLTVGPLRVRAGRGHVIAHLDGGSFVAEAFADEVAQALIDMPRTVFGPARHAELYRAIRDVAPDLVPIEPSDAEIGILRAAIDAGWDAGDAAAVTLASEALAEAQSYRRRAVAIAGLLRDLDAADAVVDTEPVPDLEAAPETSRTATR